MGIRKKGEKREKGSEKGYRRRNKWQETDGGKKSKYVLN